MASATNSAACSLAVPPPFDGKPLPRQSSPHAVRLPSLPPIPHLASPSRLQIREAWKTAAYNCRRVAGKFIRKAAGETTATVEITTTATATTTTPEVAEVPDLSDFTKKIQESWDKIEDKYTVSALAFAGIIGLWTAGGAISAIDKLPLVPGALELVGIGYTGWFAYKNLLLKADRDSLIAKLKNLYSDITGSSD
ncbi:protein CURVATURE THYLAKOID 1B, chloroplastic-like [Curcuma longa]|uniref:protein CURVATURE THYLAKOID 1B, chloroplastic-like n=1 Tax=Curcuma longa TaxID=136217 RepID=UPI003D9E532D